MGIHDRLEIELKFESYGATILLERVLPVGVGARLRIAPVEQVVNPHRQHYTRGDSVSTENQVREHIAPESCAVEAQTLAVVTHFIASAHPKPRQWRGQVELAQALGRIK